MNPKPHRLIAGIYMAGHTMHMMHARKHFIVPSCQTGRNRFMLFLLSLLMAGMFISCRNNNPEGQQQQEEMKANVVVVQPDSLSFAITATGDLLPNEQVELRAPVAGNIMGIYFREGENVKKGALLVKIDSRTWEARKNGLKARLKTAGNELERKKNLLKIEGSSQEEVEQAEASVQELQSQINELDVTIGLSAIQAPFRGRVGMRNISPGAFLSRGEPITKLTQLNPIKVHFSVPSKYARQIEKNQKVKVISVVTGDTAEAKIYAVDPVIDPSNRSIQVRALLQNPGYKYIPGSFVEVLLDVSADQLALMVPAESVIRELNNHVVYTLSKGKARRQIIEVGMRTKDRVQVLSGLSAGDTVLVTGLLEVSEGKPVTAGKIKSGGAL